MRRQIETLVAATGFMRNSFGTILADVRSALHLLQQKQRIRYLLVVICQVVLGFLDLIGVVLIGVVGALVVIGIQGSSGLADGPIKLVSQIFPVDDPLVTAAIVAAIGAGFLIVKTVLSSILIRRMLSFLAGQQVQISGSILKKVLAKLDPGSKLANPQELSYIFLEGASQASVILLGSAAVAISEVSLIILLSAALFIANWALTIVALGMFLGVAVLLHLSLNGVAGKAGLAYRTSVVAGTQDVTDAIAAYRELTVTNRMEGYRVRILESIVEYSKGTATLQFVAQIPKFVFETALVIGALLLLLSQIRTSNTATALGTVALFLAASTRLMPSLLRLQVSLINIGNAGTRAASTFEISQLIEESDTRSKHQSEISVLETPVVRLSEFRAEVSLRDVFFAYETEPVLKNINFNVTPGDRIAIVGSTGAGKSTLLDLLLGVISPTSGSVAISGVAPRVAFSTWPGSVGYVPQSVTLINGTIRENLALGMSSIEIDDERAWEALELAQLARLLDDSRQGLSTQVGDRGMRLSGGQRQRLGLARALYSRPTLLVLDEATSALDAETESVINEMIQNLGEGVTTVTVAHRLSTVRNSNRVTYLHQGRIAAEGTFEEVRRMDPQFDQQAKLSGL